MAARIASSRAVTIIILVANSVGVVNRIICEVARSLDEKAAAKWGRHQVCGHPLHWSIDGCLRAIFRIAEITCRIVGLSTDAKDNAVLDDVFRLTWRALMSEKTIQCDY